jgi:hypothetical protein
MGAATDKVLHGSGRIAYIFADRIARMALQYLAKFEQGLGHTMAHEVGHLLLGTNSHAPTGLMIADWHPLEPHIQTLTPEQVQVIRVRATATQGMWSRSIHSDCDGQIEVGSRGGREGSLGHSRPKISVFAVRGAPWSSRGRSSAFRSRRSTPGRHCEPSADVRRSRG